MDTTRTSTPGRLKPIIILLIRRETDLPYRFLDIPPLPVQSTGPVGSGPVKSVGSTNSSRTRSISSATRKKTAPYPPQSSSVHAGRTPSPLSTDRAAEGTATRRTSARFRSNGLVSQAERTGSTAESVRLGRSLTPDYWEVQAVQASPYEEAEAETTVQTVQATRSIRKKAAPIRSQSPDGDWSPLLRARRTPSRRCKERTTEGANTRRSSLRLRSKGKASPVDPTGRESVSADREMTPDDIEPIIQTTLAGPEPRGEAIQAEPQEQLAQAARPPPLFSPTPKRKRKAKYRVIIDLTVDSDSSDDELPDIGEVFVKLEQDELVPRPVASKRMRVESPAKVAARAEGDSPEVIFLEDFREVGGRTGTSPGLVSVVVGDDVGASIGDSVGMSIEDEPRHTSSETGRQVGDDLGNGDDHDTGTSPGQDSGAGPELDLGPSPEQGPGPSPVRDVGANLIRAPQASPEKALGENPQNGLGQDDADLSDSDLSDPDGDYELDTAVYNEPNSGGDNDFGHGEQDTQGVQDVQPEVQPTVHEQEPSDQDITMSADPAAHNEDAQPHIHHYPIQIDPQLLGSTEQSQSSQQDDLNQYAVLDIQHPDSPEPPIEIQGPQPGGDLEPAILDPQGIAGVYETTVDNYWTYLFFRFCAERHRMQEIRVADPTVPRDQLTEDETMKKLHIGNVFRELDPTSKMIAAEIIGQGDQSHVEVCFRVFLFCSFYNRSTWEALCNACGGMPKWSNFERQLPIMDATLHRISVVEKGKIYNGGFQLVPPTIYFSNGYRNRDKSYANYAASLRLVMAMMKAGLPDRLKACKYAVDANEVLRTFPTLGGFLALNIVCFLNNTSNFTWYYRNFASCGPGSRSYLQRIFGKQIICSGPMEDAGLRWLYENQWRYWSRLGLDPPYAWQITGVRPGMRVLDIENALCWCHRYVNAFLNKGYANIGMQPFPAYDPEVTEVSHAPAWCEEESHAHSSSKAAFAGDYDEVQERTDCLGDEVYEVEKIVCRHGGTTQQTMKKRGYFRVRWKGYTPEEDTLELMGTLEDGASEALDEWLTWEYSVWDSINIVKKSFPHVKPGWSAQEEQSQAMTATYNPPCLVAPDPLPSAPVDVEDHSVGVTDIEGILERLNADQVQPGMAEPEDVTMQESMGVPVPQQPPPPGEDVTRMAIAQSWIMPELSNRFM